MYHRNMYTNTSNVKAVAGLIFVTFATTAVVLYTPQICEGIATLARKGKEKAEELAHRGKKPYAVVGHMHDGRFYDTGERLWR